LAYGIGWEHRPRQKSSKSRLMYGTWRLLLFIDRVLILEYWHIIQEIRRALVPAGRRPRWGVRNKKRFSI